MHLKVHTQKCMHIHIQGIPFQPKPYYLENNAFLKKIFYTKVVKFQIAHYTVILI